MAIFLQKISYFLSRRPLIFVLCPLLAGLCPLFKKQKWPGFLTEKAKRKVLARPVRISQGPLAIIQEFRFKKRIKRTINHRPPVRNVKTTSQNMLFLFRDLLIENTSSSFFGILNCIMHVVHFQQYRLLLYPTPSNQFHS